MCTTATAKRRRRQSRLRHGRKRTKFEVREMQQRLAKGRRGK